MAHLAPSAYVRSLGLAAIRKLQFWYLLCGTLRLRKVPPMQKSGTHRKHQFSFPPFCSFFLRSAVHISGGKGKPFTIPQPFRETCHLGGKGRGRQSMQAAALNKGLPRATYNGGLHFSFSSLGHRSYQFLRYPGEGMTPYKNPIRTIL